MRYEERTGRRRASSRGGCALALLLGACGQAAEAPRRALPVVVLPAAGNGEPNDLGWTVTVTRFRAVIAELAFTVEGEAHARGAGTAAPARRAGARAPGRAFARWLLPAAHAHPGHLAGGQVAGSLPGTFAVDWLGEAGRVLGTGWFILAEYHGIDAALPPGAAPPLPAGDPLAGASAFIEGSASKDGRTIAFTARLQTESGAQLVGAPLQARVDAAADLAIGVGLVLREPTLGDSFFRRIDFAALDPDGDGQVVIAPGSDAHNLLRRRLAEHIHYRGAAVASPRGAAI